MPDRRWSLSAESITAAAAVVAALIALAVGVWENVQDRRHNRLSVIPHVDFVIQLNRSEHPDSADRAEIRMINEGVGPAILDDMRIRIGNDAGVARVYNDWGEALERVESWGAQVESHARVSEGTVLGVGREYPLLRLEVPKGLPEGTVHPFDRFLDQVGIVLTYTSIYGDEFESTFNIEE